MDIGQDPPCVLPFTDGKTEPDKFFKYKGKFSSPSNILVIDNGSYNCRMGWHKNDTPSVIYKPVMAKTRKEKGKESELLVANDIANIEAFRFNLKTPFDKNIVTQFESMETILDYGFAHLGLNDVGGGAVAHPILLTESVANPSLCRGMMSELLFECYNVPKVCYGIDALFSWNNSNLKDKPFAIVISCGFHSIHLIPIVDGKINSEGVRRINVGGFHLTNFLQRVFQLKYPGHVNSLTISRAEEMLHSHCHIAEEFKESLGHWSNHEYYARHVKRMQLPFTMTASSSKPAADAEALKQRRQELAKRLVEMNQRKREEKLLEDESLLKTLTTCIDLYELGYEDKVKRMLARHGVSEVKCTSDLQSLAKKVQQKIEKTKVAMARKADKGDQGEDEPETKKAKRKTRDEMNDAERDEFDSWISDLRHKRLQILEKRSARQNRKQQLQKRRTAASQERMRMISQLAKNTKKDDNFGMNDDDWDVYKMIRKDTGDSDSEEEQLQLAEVEEQLREHDEEYQRELREQEEAEISRDTPEWHQVHLAAEQIRAPEILFQPSIIGVEQAGIPEALEFILNKYSTNVQEQLVNNIFVTGSLARLPGFKSRLEHDIRQFRPFKSKFNVSVAEDPSLSAWQGAARFARDLADNHDSFVTKQEYEERGNDYFKEHKCSNIHNESK